MDAPEDTQTVQRDAIITGLIDGRSLRSICRDEGMPSVTTVMRWCQTDLDWREQYARARAAGDDVMVEDIQDIADDEKLDPQARRVRIDARKWILSKRQPKKYGEKQLIGSDPDHPLPSPRGVDLTRLSESALREIASLDPDA